MWQIRLASSVSPWSGLDTTAYVELAQRVQAGDWGLGPGLYYLSPFYIYFLAITLAITKSFTAVRLVQALLGTVAIWFMFQTARAWFNARAAWAAAILAAFTGLFAFYEALILQTAVDVFLTSAALLCLTRALQPVEPARNAWIGACTAWMFSAGAIFGAQTMNRPNVAIAVFLLAAMLFVLRRWRLGLVLAAGLVIGLSPAAIRNAVVSHQFSLLSSHGGLNFYIGNGQGADGFYRFVPGITPTIKGQANDARNVASKALGHAVDDAGASDYFMGITWQHMAAHPFDATLLLVRKFGWTFHAQHVPLPYSFPFYQRDFPTWLRFMVIGPWILVPLGVAGLVFGRSGFRVHRPTFDDPYWIFVAFVPAYAIAVALFFMSERYRLPLLVPLVIGSGAAIDRVMRAIHERTWRALAAPAAVTLILLVAVNTRTIANDGRWEEGLRMAAQLVLEDRYDEANAWVDRLEAERSRPGNASGSIGLQLLVKNQPARALPLLERAAALEPNTPAVEYALGQALLGVGRPADAIPHLQFGFEHDAPMPMVGFHLAAALKDVGRTAEAIAALPKIKMSDEASADNWLTVGRLGMELKAPEAAVPFLKKGVELAPSNPDARLQAGVALVVLKRFDEAAQELSEAVRLQPGNAAALAYLAYSETQLGQRDSAARHLAQALAIDPNDPMAKLLASMR